MRLTTRTLLVAALCAGAAITSAQTSTTEELKSNLDTIFDDPKWENARWGIDVFDITASQTLYQRDANKSFMPASNMKLYTTAAALTTLGADYTYKTHIYADGTTDSNGLLRGNIIVRGSGDPSISGRYLEGTSTTQILQTWAAAIRDAGIKKIDGQIIGDDDIFDDDELCGTWSLGYLNEWYAAESSGLAINDNCWDVYVKPAPAPGFSAIATNLLDPPVAERPNLRTAAFRSRDQLQFISSVTTTPDDDGPSDKSAFAADQATTGSSDGDPGIEARIRYDREAKSNTIQLTGTIEADSLPYREWGSIHNGTYFTVSLLDQHLRALGIESQGPIDIDDLPEAEDTRISANPGSVVYTHVSPALPKILAIINKPSQNFYADMMLKTLGATATSEGSWSTGEQVVKDFLTTAGADARSLNMSDGSGLSRFNQVEPRQTIALLKAMHSRPDFHLFEASLPVMGIDGTLRGRMRGTPAEGKVKAKTGTIGRVRALSGYLTAANGHTIAFSMMANNYTVSTSEATIAQDDAILQLLSFTGNK